MISIDPILLNALEKGTGVPFMRCELYNYMGAGMGWVQEGDYDVLEAVLTRDTLDVYITENILASGLVDSVVSCTWGIQIIRGVKVAGTNYGLVGHIYFISELTYSVHEARSHIIADLLPTTSLVAINGNQTAQNVLDAAWDQFNQTNVLVFDTNRDIWFGWKFFDTNKDLNLIDGRMLSSVIQQKYFAYFFPRYYHLPYPYGVASNKDNNLDGTYTPFAHARTTFFLWPDKPINLTWDSETGYQEYIGIATSATHSLGFIANADNPTALAKFQEWTRIPSGYCIQYIQRPDMRLDQGDLIKVSADGFAATRCFEQIEIYKKSNQFAKGDLPASWYQIVRQLPYHPQYNVQNRRPNDWWTPGGSDRGGITNGINSMAISNNTIVQANTFQSALNADDSNLQQALETLDVHTHAYSAITGLPTLGTIADNAESDFAIAAKGVTNGDSHDHVGGDGAQVDHGGLAGLSDDDHTQYIKHSLVTAASDFLVASGSGTVVKKTLAETKTILNIDKNVIQILLNTTTALTTGDNKARIRIPAKYNGMNLTAVAASRQSGTGVPSIQVRNATDAVDMLSTPITIDTGETDSSTAATPPVINTSYDDVVTGDQIAIDVDGAGTTTLSCVVELIFG
jgi:hypothetical protein